ncbi:MAG: ABC transporter substrate-binding protein [Dehalococcoidia bacterium]|nr:ABC transporter substrate-binding protein [Dehalococcoidia bacterium]
MAASLLALAAIILTGCSDSSGGHTGAPSEPIVVGDENVVSSLPVTVTSADGREVTITDTSRIVPLWGNITEVVYGLGLGSHVVARDVSATFPEAAALPTVTRGHDISAEGVLSLKPTLVLASADNSGPSSALDQIRSVGIPVVVFEDPASVEDIIPRIRAIAQTLGVPDAGEALVQRTEAELATARDGIPANAGSPRVAFLYMRGQAGVYLIGGPGSGADSMIRAAGATDAGTAMGLNDPFTPITSEALAKAAPDIILMTSSGLDSVGGVDGLVKIPGIAQTPAGKDRRIVTVEDGLLYSFGPRTPAALETLIELLYPSQATVRTP